MNKAFHFIQKRVVINLAKRTDRMEAFRAMASEYLAPVERYEAVEPGPFSGAAGNLHSISQVVTKAFNKGAPRLLMFEDDARLRPDSVHSLTHVEEELNALGDKWDLYMLGLGLQKPNEITMVSQRTAKVSKCGGTHACIFSRAGMEKIREWRIETPKQAAWWIKESGKQPDVMITSKLRAYLHIPLLFNQAAGFSDIAQRVTNTSPSINRYETHTLLPAASGA